VVEQQMDKLLETVYLSEVVCVFEWFKRFRGWCDSFGDESSNCQLWTAKNLKQLQKVLNWWPESV